MRQKYTFRGTNVEKCRVFFIVCLFTSTRNASGHASDQRTSAVTKRKLSDCVRTLSHCASRSRSAA